MNLPSGVDSDAAGSDLGEFLYMLEPVCGKQLQLGQSIRQLLQLCETVLRLDVVWHLL